MHIFITKDFLDRGRNMEFVNELKKLSEQIENRKKYITNEEATKQSLIIPFLNILGYDVFNPFEVEPEYCADFGMKKGEKVDYAIKKDGIPIIFIEAKSIYEKLESHNAQLYRYFNSTTSVKFAILTNGDEYKFFTDLNQENIMDKSPFFTFRMSSLSNMDAEILQRFTKANFDSNQLVEFAEELVYMININQTLKELFRNPSDEFLRFLIRDFTNTRITNNVLDRFRPIVKKAINQTMLSIISEGLSKGEDADQNGDLEALNAEPSENAVEDQENGEGKESNILTTKQELKSFEIIRDILSKENRDVSEVKYKETGRYFGIMNRVVTRWFVRINYNSRKPHFNLRIDPNKCKQLIPSCIVEESPKKEGLSRVYIDKPEELYKYSSLIVASYDSVKE
jgi:predicted type IV restriction endonuclease